MAASGSLYYFRQDLGTDRFRGPDIDVLASEAMERNTMDLIEDICTYGDPSWFPNSISGEFGYTLKSGVPKQLPINSNDSNIEYDLNQYWNKVKKFHCISKDKKTQKFAEIFKNSITKQKIFNLHRWGWREANRCVPNTKNNVERLNHFISFWYDFCDQYSAAKLAENYSTMMLNIFHVDSDLEWESILVEHNGKKIQFHPSKALFKPLGYME